MIALFGSTLPWLSDALQGIRAIRYFYSQRRAVLNVYCGEFRWQLPLFTYYRAFVPLVAMNVPASNEPLVEHMIN